MPLKIVIPSHKRHDAVFSKKLVTDPIICVAESQAEQYRQYNPDCEIVAHPDDVVGLIPKRNWMAEYFGDLFMLDDDVTVCKRLFAEKGEATVEKDRRKIRQIIEDVYDMACMLDINLFGFTSRTTPVMYDEFQWFSLANMITGCSYGVRKSKNALDANFIEGMACVGGCIGGAGCLTHGEKNKAAVDSYGREALEKTILDAIAPLR